MTSTRERGLGWGIVKRKLTLHTLMGYYLYARFSLVGPDCNE